MKYKIRFLIMMLIMTFVLSINTSADDGILDLTIPGSLTFIMEYNNKALTDGQMNLYYVGSIEKVDQDVYEFVILPALEVDHITEEQLNDPEIASNLLSKAKTILGESKRIVAPIANGQAAFEDLDIGLYLVWQEETDASTGMSPICPFLISVPRWQGNNLVMDVIGTPKVSVEPEPNEPPPPPPPTPPLPPPELPQTGQLKWPIPVMGITGGVLFVLGAVLCLNKKRAKNEK